MERALFYRADLSYTFLHEANVIEVCLTEANISWTQSTGARWTRAMLVDTDLARTMV